MPCPFPENVNLGHIGRCEVAVKRPSSCPAIRWNGYPRTPIEIKSTSDERALSTRRFQLKVKHWCSWQGSNLRPHPYQGCALPLCYSCIKR